MTDVTYLEQTVSGVLEGVERLYVLGIINTVLIISVGICLLLYKAVKNFY